MIGIALIVILAITLCKEHKVIGYHSHENACSMASHQSPTTSAKASVTETEGVVVSDDVSVLDVSPLITGDWMQPKKLSASEEETNKILNDYLTVEEQEHYDKQMKNNSCNTEKHTYEKIVTAFSPILPKPPRPTYRKTLGNAGQIHDMLRFAGRPQTRPKVMTQLWFNDSLAHFDALNEQASE
tara:strand:- start:178 stop:729 length:552 start_codon:yes stop_codon:yes gene_type:complete